MTHIDNSQGMSPEQVKEALTNLISKTAQKATAEGKYDRTILAKIQYCTDATLGQYKIQYQNGYYTAYSLDKTKRYSDGSSVYVTVPQNDLNNRLFIQDLATNDNSQRTYLTNLEGDQQFATYGQNLIKSVSSSGLDLSSHWDMPKGREVFYYTHDASQNINNRINLLLDGEIISSIRNGDGYFRLGAKFKTNLTDDRKVQGNYGIRVVLVFNRTNGVETEEYKQTYQLDTFSMAGSPFEFNEYSERYNYWQIDKDNFVRIESISGFVEGFPQSSVRPEPIDIFIKDINLYSAIKLYDAVEDYTFKVNIYGPQGFSFNLPADGEEETTSLRLEGQFTINGNPVDTKEQQVEFFWAKKNLNIDSVGNTKYLSYFGEGWQCINESQATEAPTNSLADLQNYTILPEDTRPGYRGVIKWDSMESYTLPKSLCPGRETIIKCCVRYQNNSYFSREYIVYNTTGYYLLLDSDNGIKFYNGKGSTTLTAGVFRTQSALTTYGSTPVPNPFQPVSNIVFKWQIENNNVKYNIPSNSKNEFLVSEPDWSSQTQGIDYSDTPDETAVNVNTYLINLAALRGIDKILLENCYQRWEYYTRFYQNYEGEETDAVYITAKSRADTILTSWQAQLDKYYAESFQNPEGFYILGPSKVYPKWTVDPDTLQQMFMNREDPFSYAAIDHIEHTYNTNNSTYSDYQRNTLYKLRAADIAGQMKVSVTASLVETVSGQTVYTPLETKDIYLTNQEGSGLKYDLQIENGVQNIVYNASGQKPQISLKPLSFKLFSEDGSLVFDSSKEENRNSWIEILKPKWKFYVGSTLLVTKYVGTNYCVPDTDVLNRYVINREPIFYFDIADDYNINYKERSNVELIVSYEGSNYTAETNFTFSKQGELGTNGTNTILSIEDNKYEQYRSDVLAMDMFSQFKKYNGENSAILDTYYPNERHLKDTYLYATHIYDNSTGEWLEQEGFDNGSFCNLQFAQSGSESDIIVDPSDPMHITLNGSSSATLRGYWTENNTTTIVDSTSKWSTSNGNMQELRDQTKLGRARVYDRASFQINPTSGSSTVITLVPPVGYENEFTYYYKPMEVTYVKDNLDYEWTAYNVVQCEAKRIVQEQINPINDSPIERTNYGYFKIPFFYYAYYKRENGGAYVNLTPSGLDPARHFVVFGGYDEVLYDADGINPQYNRQNPFTFKLFDLEGNDITEAALSGVQTNVTWKCSYGLRHFPITNSIPAYSSFAAGQSLLHKYCTYNGQTYYCVKNHTPDQKVEVKDADGVIMKVYNANGTTPYDFVTPYWEKVSPNVAKNTMNFAPPPTYEACAADSLFSSWVSVKISYILNDNEKYEAAALLPINILQNVYGSDEINGWDGKKTVVDDGYIISNKVAAGYKDKSNAFIGVTIGTKMITNGVNPASNNEENIQCGLFGYGKYTDSNLSAGRVGYGQTLFLDAKTGLAAFGPRGSTQIILNPRIPKQGTTEESWSRLAGWYFSNNYLYKPLFADDTYDGTGSYIDTSTGNMVATNTSTKDYYDISPPDANGAQIPGSVGIYVPSTDAGTLGPETVFLWASAAGMNTVDFNDNGAFDGLKKIVTDIQDKFNQSDFPFYYSGLRPRYVYVEPNIDRTFMIANINELANVYSDDSTLLDLISTYNTAFTNFQMATGQDAAGLIEELNTTILSIQNIINASTFPVVIRDGAQVKPDLSNPLTISNIEDLKKWYLNSNEPSVTAQSTDLASLNTAINNYERYRNDLANNPGGYEDIDFAIQALQDATSLIKSHFEDLTFTKREKSVSDWDTGTAVVPIIDSDTVTITNISELTADYARAAYLASSTAQTYITDVNALFSNYAQYHTLYETWKSTWDTTKGHIVTYNSDNTEKLKSNFAVTYGGHLYCSHADVRGKITALTGEIGEGSNKIEIGVHKDRPSGGSQYYLLWNKAFKVSYEDSATGMDSAVFVDGEITARRGKIGNTDETADGNDNHTVFMEYNWYPRKLPDDDIRWGDRNTEGVNYRKPVWDTTQGAIVKYALWHPYFSIIDDPNGAKNYKYNGTEDFSYKAGDTCFLGRIYATGGRLGDWICDSNHDLFRDPYDTIKMHPALVQGEPDSGWINCGNMTLYGDGSIYGGCSVPSGQDPARYQYGTLPKSTATWWITSDGEAHFTNLDSEYIGKSFKTSTSGGTSISSSGISTSGTVSVGGASMSGSGGSVSFSGGASFGGSITTSGSLNASSFATSGATLGSSSLTIGSTSLSGSSASLPSTTLSGNLAMGSYAITGVGNISSSGTINANTMKTTSLQVNGYNIDAYIKGIIKSDEIKNWIINVVKTYINSNSSITGVASFSSTPINVKDTSGNTVSVIKSSPSPTVGLSGLQVLIT